MFKNVEIKAAWTNVSRDDLIEVAKTMDALGFHRDIKDDDTAVLKISHVHPDEKAGNRCAFVNHFTREVTLSYEGKAVARHELVHFFQRWGGLQWACDRPLPWALKSREMEADVVALMSFAPEWALNRFKEKGYSLLEAAGVCRLLGRSDSFAHASNYRLTVTATMVAIMPKSVALCLVKSMAAGRSAWYEKKKATEDSDFYQFYKDLAGI